MKEKNIKIGLIIICIIGISLTFFLNMEKDKAEELPESHQANKQLLDEIYLYHSNKVEKITDENDIYDGLTDEILHIINDSEISEYTIDGTYMFEGHGVPMDESQQDYFIEVNLAEPITTTYAGTSHQNVSRILISLENNCIYIFKADRAEENQSFAGYECKESSLNKVFSIVKDLIS